MVVRCETDAVRSALMDCIRQQGLDPILLPPRAARRSSCQARTGALLDQVTFELRGMRCTAYLHIIAGSA